MSRYMILELDADLPSDDPNAYTIIASADLIKRTAFLVVECEGIRADVVGQHTAQSGGETERFLDAKLREQRPETSDAESPH